MTNKPWSLSDRGKLRHRRQKRPRWRILCHAPWAQQNPDACCGRGGIGRRARLRAWWGLSPRGGSSPLARIDSTRTYAFICFRNLFDISSVYPPCIPGWMVVGTDEVLSESLGDSSKLFACIVFEYCALELREVVGTQNLEARAPECPVAFIMVCQAQNRIP